MTHDEPLSDEAGAEVVVVQLLTRAMLRERNYRSSGKEFELAFLRRDGEWFSIPISSLHRVRAILAELGLSSDDVDVICGLDEDRTTLHARATGAAPIHLH